MKKRAEKGKQQTAAVEAITKAPSPATLGGCAMERRLIHEVNEKEQHRIVIVTREHQLDHSAWFEQHEIAHYKGFLAMVGWGREGLLPGVFTLQPHPYTRLGAHRFSHAELVAPPRDTERSD